MHPGDKKDLELKQKLEKLLDKRDGVETALTVKEFRSQVSESKAARVKDWAKKLDIKEQFLRDLVAEPGSGLVIAKAGWVSNRKKVRQ